MCEADYNVTYDETWLHECSIKGFTDATTHLQKIIRTSKGGILIPSFYTKKKGRYAYKGSVSIALLSCPFRHSLCKDEYVDFDMTNAHFKIIEQLCVNNNIEKKYYEYIHSYVYTRDEIREKLRKLYFPNRNFKEAKDDIKKLFLIIMYGGSFATWCGDVGLPKDTKQDSTSEHIQNEIIGLTNRIKQHNLDEYVMIKKRVEAENKAEEKKAKKEARKPRLKSVDSSFLSVFLQDWEAKIIETAVVYMEQEHHIKDNVFIYTFDGFMVLKDDDMDTETICEELNDFIRGRLNMDIFWETKDFDKHQDDIFFPPKKTYEFPEDKLNLCNFDYLKQLRSYNEKRAYFEKFVIKTIEPSPMIWIKSQKKEMIEGRIKVQDVINFMSCEELKKSWNEIKLNEQKQSNSNSITTQIAFIDKWLDDEDKRRAYRHDFIPYPTDPRDREEVDDVFNTFSGYNRVCFDDKMEYSDKELDGFFYILKNLLGGDKDDLDAFNQLIATKIQHPEFKIPHSILIKSKEGEGKNTIMDAIGLVIGLSHYYYTSNIQDVLGTHAEGIINKLIVVLNEMGINDTKLYTRQFKSLITEIKQTANPKNIRPFEVLNLALYILLSNEQYPIFIDAREGDRRWFIFEGNEKNKQLSHEQWSAVHKRFKTPEFTKALYDFYMSIDLKNATPLRILKIRNSQKPAYKSIITRYIKPELLFIYDYITNKTLISNKMVYDHKNKPTEGYYFGYSKYDALPHNEGRGSNTKEACWYEDGLYMTNHFYIKGTNLLYDFNVWAKENGYNLDKSNKCSKTFYSNLTSADVSIQSKRKDGNSEHIHFTPHKVIKLLIDKNYVEIEDFYLSHMNDSVKEAKAHQMKLEECMTIKEAVVDETKDIVF